MKTATAKKTLDLPAVTRLVLVLTALVFALLSPARADAMPNSWRGTPTVTKGGVTYRLRKSDRAAVVVRVRKAEATVRASVRYRGTTYRVRCIWDGSLRGVKRLTVKSTLRDGCEDPRLWKVGTVRVTDPGVYRWLRSTGASVTLVSK